MGNLKEIRTRIGSVKSTQQITNAMKMVAASKLRRAQDAIIKLRPYANKLKNVMGELIYSVDDLGENPFVKEREIKRVLIIAVTSNRGLCGGFNTSVIKEANKLIASKYSELSKAGKVDIICIGKKANDYFKRRNFNIIGNYSDLFGHLTYDNVVVIAKEITNKYLNKEFDRVEIIYNQFKNAAVQVLTSEQFLPLQLISTQETKTETKNDYIFEPDKKTIIEGLIPKALRIQFYKALLDSYASEHGARMTAMHKATDNATEILKELNQEYNKARQASITKEILEIVGGAEALKG